MILLVDVGNSNIVFAFADENKVYKSFRLKSFIDKTSDEYYLLLRTLIGRTEFDDVIISSVVPVITSALVKVFNDYYRINAKVLGQGFKTGIMQKVDDPKSTGADLICDLVGSTLYGDNFLIIDMGTATKYLHIKNKVFDGAIISPGVAVSMKAMISGAALLPNIELQAPKKVLGANTVACMQSGVVYGAACEVDGIIERVREELKDQNMKIIATGGLSSFIVPLCKNEIKLVPNLTLEGLLEIYNKNK